MVRLDDPGPMIWMGVVMASCEVHVTLPLPAVTLMVSPGDAWDTQDDTLASSGVLVHVGLLPVHCARAAVTKSALKRRAKEAPLMVLIIANVPPYEIKDTMLLYVGSYYNSTLVTRKALASNSWPFMDFAAATYTTISVRTQRRINFSSVIAKGPWRNLLHKDPYPFDSPRSLCHRSKYRAALVMAQSRAQWHGRPSSVWPRPQCPCYEPRPILRHYPPS